MLRLHVPVILSGCLDYTLRPLFLLLIYGNLICLVFFKSGAPCHGFFDFLRESPRYHGKLLKIGGGGELSIPDNIGPLGRKERAVAEKFPDHKGMPGGCWRFGNRTKFRECVRI